MPLRQSTLNFRGQTRTSLTIVPEISPSIPQRSTSSSPVESDTIVVDTTDINAQLPTPSESATDVSSQGSHTTLSNTTGKPRSKRVSTARERKNVFREVIDTDVDAEHDKNRSVSGETLVAEETTTSHSNSIGAKVEEFCQSEHKMDLDVEDLEEHDEETSSIITVREEDSEDEKLREERWLAKKAKMDQNAKKWEERKRDAEKNATRRSGRSSLLGKANELIDSIKDTVLGKRTRNANETDGNTSKNAAKSRTADTSSHPPSKKQRIDEDTAEEEKPIPKQLTTRREKKWLTSGLFAGQPRMFDARLNENKNKRKSKGSEETQQKENSTLPLPMFAGERLLQHGRDFKLPFDVFSPLPPGQPKPDEWKKVNKNVFVGDAAAIWRTSKYIEHSTCLCTGRIPCGQDCMNKYMYYECDDHNCNVGPVWCTNRPFAGLAKRTKIGGKYNVGVEVIRTVDRGYGVRSNRTFEPNQIIVEYTGEIITQDECEQRMRTIYKNNECYYLMLFDQNMIIDATRGSIARFVNHSCEPNCRMEKWTVGGKPRMALFAGDRGIMTGEELTYDYNFDPYSQKNVQECRCGSKSCRGVLGPKPKPEVKRVSPESQSTKKKSSKLGGAKRKVAEVLEESTHQANKKRKSQPLSGKTKKSQTKVRANSKSPKRAVLVKKATVRKMSSPKSMNKLARSDSKLKKMLTGAKSKVGSLKNRNACTVSSSSAAKPLLGGKKSNKLARTSSLKAKAKSVTNSVRNKSKTITVAG